jgi:hypothetical protein
MHEAKMDLGNFAKKLASHEHKLHKELHKSECENFSPLLTMHELRKNAKIYNI